MKYTPMNFTNELLLLIYGNNVDVTELRKIKDQKTIWNDIVLYLANGDITKMEDVKKMSFIEVMDVLKSKVELQQMSKTKIEVPRPKLGFKQEKDKEE